VTGGCLVLWRADLPAGGGLVRIDADLAVALELDPDLSTTSRRLVETRACLK
jgi:hypothetical protein